MRREVTNHGGIKHLAGRGGQRRCGCVQFLGVVFAEVRSSTRDQMCF